MSQSYTSHSIKVLRGLDAVRKRPGMYIGDTDDGSGLHHMIYEVVDNAMDEALAGHCTKIDVVLLADGSISVQDNGRGIPTDIHPQEGVSGAEVIMTQLHAGGKFDQDSYKISGGLHGVGVSVVNALSQWLDLVIWQNGKEYAMSFQKGVPQAPLATTGVLTDQRGTKVTFMPSREIFSNVAFDLPTIEKRLRELAFLNAGIVLNLRDERSAPFKEITFCYEGGLASFVTHLDQNKNSLHRNLITIKGERDGIVVELAMHWTQSYQETMFCYTNNIPQKDGGNHLSGFRSSLTRVVHQLFSKQKKEKVTPVGEDSREGLTCVLSVKMADPKFSSQTKDKLVSSEVRPAVESIVTEHLDRWFLENPVEAKGILEHILKVATAREEARKAKELVQRKDGLSMASLPGKLADCSEKDPSLCELFLVEGEGAGGSSKSARNRENQAVLPLRGKILNVEKADFSRMLSSAEIGTLIKALGTGIGTTFDLKKLRYHKIVIMTDADVDGSHIRTLLLTFFFRHMRPLIDAGHLYIAQPPLYSVKMGGQKIYLKNEASLHDFLVNHAQRGLIISGRSGEVIIGLDLAQIVKKSIRVHQIIGRLAQGLNIFPDFFYKLLAVDDLESCDSSGLVLALERMNTPWSYQVEEDGAIVIRQIHQEEKKFFFNTFVHHVLYQDFISYKPFLKEFFPLQTEQKIIETPCELFQFIVDRGKRGIVLQRYKGLGEMEAVELWETTLDPLSRTLCQVTVQVEEKANDVVSILMGDVVAPRKAFIQENALDVLHVDA